MADKKKPKKKVQTSAKNRCELCGRHFMTARGLNQHKVKDHAW